MLFEQKKWWQEPDVFFRFVPNLTQQMSVEDKGVIGHPTSQTYRTSMSFIVACIQHRVTYAKHKISDILKMQILQIQCLSHCDDVNGEWSFIWCRMCHWLPRNMQGIFELAAQGLSEAKCLFGNLFRSSWPQLLVATFNNFLWATDGWCHIGWCQMTFKL